MKTPEYREGPEALESFKTLATAILQANPKKKKKQKRRGSSWTATKDDDQVCAAAFTRNAQDT